jgi:hypothetical protein
MGTVWLARRSDGRFEGDVAVKLVNLSVFDSFARERFAPDVVAPRLFAYSPCRSVNAALEKRSFQPRWSQ